MWELKEVVIRNEGSGARLGKELHGEAANYWTEAWEINDGNIFR